MQHTQQNVSVQSSRLQHWVWMVAAGSAALGAAWFVIDTVSVDSQSQAQADASRSADELRKLKASVHQLERKSAALQAAVVASESRAFDDHDETDSEAKAEDQKGPGDEVSEGAADPEAELAKHREALRELDTVLASETGNLSERRSSEATFREQLDVATAGQAKVVDLECGSDFCKAVLEEDTSAQPAMDIGAMIDQTPFLREEAMFDYEYEGTYKRTHVYAALEGRSLPFDRDAYPAP